MNLAVYWLVVRMGVIGEPMITLEDSKQPDRDTCMARAAEVLEKAEHVTEGYDEFFVTCSIERPKSDPA